MKPVFVYFNGPPRSGKDECVKGLWMWAKRRPKTNGEVRIYKISMARPLKLALGALIGRNLSEVEAAKEDEIAPGLTGRQALISLSTWAKGTIRKDILALLALDEVRRILATVAGKPIVPVFAFSDIGFEFELDPFVRGYPGCEHLLIRLFRHGFSFRGDNREYIQGFDRTTDVKDKKEVADLHREVASIVEELIHD